MQLEFTVPLVAWMHCTIDTGKLIKSLQQSKVVSLLLNPHCSRKLQQQEHIKSGSGASWLNQHFTLLPAGQ